MDLLELLRGFVKVVCIFLSPFAKQTKLKLDQDFKTYQSFCFGLEVIPDICHEPHEHVRVNFFWPV